MKPPKRPARTASLGHYHSKSDGKYNQITAIFFSRDEDWSHVISGRQISVINCSGGVVDGSLT
mgnify:CR=1 FL=1